MSYLPLIIGVLVVAAIISLVLSFLGVVLVGALKLLPLVFIALLLAVALGKVKISVNRDDDHEDRWLDN